ncbi:MAG TPA: hypothetical protein VJZ71_05655 [Phycisphaerae bacterium]|nr:hypothetical protein [Phycisphaerae bacterium]
MSGRTLTVFVTLLLGPTVPIALAQHGHMEGEHGKPAEFKMPTTYKDGVAEIQHRLHEIEELIDSSKLADVHREAEVIQKVGNVIGQLALKADSGVPKIAIKEINKAGRELAGKFDAIDKAGDSGDAAGTRKVYDEMVTLTATLQKYVAGGPHGGLVAWSVDRKRQVEATLSAANEVRIYLYDEHSKPLPVDGTKPQAHGGKKGGEHTPVSLAPDASKSSLRGRLDSGTRPPLALMISLDLGGKTQMFTFDFDAPTKAPSREHGAHEKGEHKGHKP